MRLRLLGTLVAAAALLAAPAQADVTVTIANGRVTIVANDATPRQILQEWARVGQTRVVNADRLTGPPMSIQLKDSPEAQALDTLLRSASGYVAAPRLDERSANASQFDRIFILATSSAPRPAASVPPAPPSAPAPFQPPVFAPAGDSPDDAQPRQAVPQPAPGLARPPVFTTFPQPPQAAQPRPAPVDGAVPNGGTPAGVIPAPTPGAAVPGGQVIGSARPGMPVPVPQQPGQPVPQNPGVQR